MISKKGNTSLALILKISEPPLSFTNSQLGANSFIKWITVVALPRALSTSTSMLYPSPKWFFRAREVPTHWISPFLMIAILSHRVSAYSIEWVVMRSARYCRRVWMNFQASLRLSGSIPVVGSSIIISLGFPTPPSVSESLLFIPPLNDFTRELETSSKPTSLRCSLIKLGTSLRFIPLI